MLDAGCWRFQDKNFPFVMFDLSFVIDWTVVSSMTNDKSNMTNGKFLSEISSIQHLLHSVFIYSITCRFSFSLSLNPNG